MYVAPRFIDLFSQLNKLKDIYKLLKMTVMN